MLFSLIFWANDLCDFMLHLFAYSSAYILFPFLKGFEPIANFNQRYRDLGHTGFLQAS